MANGKLDHQYQPLMIEMRAQAYWREKRCFNVDLSKKPKQPYYCLSMFPYPSGELHMGHVRNYALGDLLSRYHHALGDDVFQPMGWDAFGLPAENAAIKHKVAPDQWTRDNIDRMRAQFQRLGFAFDWDQELMTADKRFYRWGQWLFLQMLKKDLCYKQDAWVNWDPVDQTVLANEQVVDGKGWRSSAPIERRRIAQWFFKTTAYAKRLLEDLDTLEHWPEQVKSMQRNWIGLSHGAMIRFDVEGQRDPIEVFTTRPDTLFGVTYLAISPQHPLAQKLAQTHPDIESMIHDLGNHRVAEADMATIEKRGIDTGMFGICPLSKAVIPIWVANFVLAEYGTGAVMSVPAHDPRDHEFAKRYGLAIVPTIDHGQHDHQESANSQKGKLIDAMGFTGMDSDAACQAITQALEDQHLGHGTVQYRLRDWGISRQRYWGAPIPIILSEDCGDVPVDETDLPVVLPIDIPLGQDRLDLKQCEDFIETFCPLTGSPAKRETDTFDTFVDSSWYYGRFLCKDLEHAMLDERMRHWLPVSQYIGGIEHATMHLLYARFIHKVLFDMNLVSCPEPFDRLLTQGMVLNQGAKMSKSKGNTVSPQPMIERYGADALRLFILFAAPPQVDLEWSESGLEGASRFLKRVWTHMYENQKILTGTQGQFVVEQANKSEKQCYVTAHKILAQIDYDMQRQQCNTVVSGAMKLLNLMVDSHEILSRCPLLHRYLAQALTIILGPIAPHLAHVLWQDLGWGDNILKAGWIHIDQQILRDSDVTYGIAINGKRRAQMTISANANEQTCIEQALAIDDIKRHLGSASIKKSIVIPKRLINFVI